MIKQVLKRFMAMLLSIIMVCLLLPVTAMAATTLEGLSDPNIALSYDGGDENTWTVAKDSVTGNVKSTGDSCNPTVTTSTLTIKNNSGKSAKLFFNYSVELNGGTVKIGGDSVESNGEYEIEFTDETGSTQIIIESGSVDNNTSVTITNIRLIIEQDVTTTFQKAENGNYSVDGETISENKVITRSSLTPYKLVAMPDEGYKFVGWYNVTDGTYFVGGDKADIYVPSNCVLTAKFVQEGSIFGVGSNKFDDIDDAMNYAAGNNISKVTLLKDYTIEGNHTIPAGITLLIPADEAGTLYTTAPAYEKTAETQTAYRTLTMASGSAITVNGAINIGGKHLATSQSNACTTTGAYGLIKVSDDSTITINNGGNLYAWGYITGNGNIIAESGATVYEYFQVMDWRGGTATSNMANNEQKVFPFSQYYVQNIESKISFKKGASEKVLFATLLSGSYVSSFINFVGENDSMFTPDKQFTKWYDADND